MNQFFIELFEYNHNCNQRLTAVVLENSKINSGKSIELFSHILNAHQIWNNRVPPNEKTYGVWEIHPADKFTTIDKLNHEKTYSLIADYDMNENISYKNSKGQKFQNSIKNVLFHIINHSTYHRGQVAKEFRSCGIEPLNTDYIFYKR